MTNSTSLDPATDSSSVLAELYASLPLTRGLIVVSADGRVLTAELEEAKQGAIAAVVASSFALGAKLAQTVGDSPVDEMTVRTPDGIVSLYAVGHRAALAVMSMPDANVALVHLRSREAAEQLAPLVEPLLAARS